MDDEMDERTMNRWIVCERRERQICHDKEREVADLCIASTLIIK
jgi:hypothetical protein